MRVRSLQVLAGGVLGGMDVAVIAGPVGSGWSWTPSSRVIQADSEHLRARTSEFCQGLVLHELGHAAITRYHDLVPQSWLELHPMALLLNVVEDGRLERWVARVLPGGAEWIALANSELLLDAENGEAPETLAGKFLQGILHLQYFGHSAPSDPRVDEALVHAAPALSRILECLPLINDSDHGLVDAAYHHHPAAQVWLAKDLACSPSSFEKSVRMSQTEMWGEVHAYLWPLLEGLLEKDRQEGRLADRWVITVLQAMGNRGRQGNALRPEGSQLVQVKDPVEKELFPGSGETWDRLRQGQCESIASLSNRLLELFCRWGRNKVTRGHASGASPDLRAVVRAQADPREWDRVWFRREIPHRTDPCFILLLDRSGSMVRDQKAIHALEGAVVVAEACRTAGIALEVWTFAQTLSPLLSCHEQLGSRERRRIEGFVSACGGGTELSSALDGIGKRMSGLPWRDQVLLILSDGEVCDQHVVRARLDSLRARGVACLGLGVGPETRNLKALLPGSPCGIAPADIGKELCAVLSRAAGELGRG